MMLNVTQMDTGFAGVVQRLDTRDNFVMFLNKSFLIKAACEGTFKMMGVSSMYMTCESRDLFMPCLCVAAGAVVPG